MIRVGTADSDQLRRERISQRTSALPFPLQEIIAYLDCFLKLSLPADFLLTERQSLAGNPNFNVINLYGSKRFSARPISMVVERSRYAETINI